METTRPDVLICDVGDTLIRPNRYSREDGLEAMRPLCDRPERFQPAALARTGEELDAYIEPHAEQSRLEYRQSDFLRLLFGRHGMQLLCDDDNLEWLYWRAALGFEPEPNVHDGLDAIRTAGVRTALVSNTSFGPESIRRELALHGLADFFVSPIVTSARYGVRKPHPAILQAARGTFAADREVAWYVGNSVYHDLGASNAAGLTAVWYNEDGDELESSAANGERADVEVSGWLELAELIVALPKRRG